MLKADLDALRQLARDVSAKADAIDQITMPALGSVVMPGSGLEEVVADVAAKFSAAFIKQGASVRAMSDGAASCANDYEAVTHAFADQLNAMWAGLQ